MRRPLGLERLDLKAPAVPIRVGHFGPGLAMDTNCSGWLTSSVRTREYLTTAEIERLMAAAGLAVVTFKAANITGEAARA